MSWASSILIGICLLGWGSETGAAPLNVLRSLWVVEDSSWTSANPACLRCLEPSHTRIEVGYHDVAHSLAGESATQSMAGSQWVRLSRGVLEIEGEHLGTSFSFQDGGNRVSSQPHVAERLSASYSTALGAHFDLGAMARMEPTGKIDGGAVGLRLQFGDHWSADGYLHRSSSARSSTLRLDDEQLAVESRGRYTEVGFGIGAAVLPQLTLAFRGSEQRLDPGGHSGGYALNAGGGLRTLRGSWGAQILRGLAVVGDVRYRTLEGNPEGRLDGRRFLRSEAHLSDFTGSTWVRLGGAGNHLDVGLFTSRGEVTARLRRLESWPFYNSFVSLLGGKDWSGSGQVDLRLVGAGVRLKKRTRVWTIETDTRILRASSSVAAVLRERTKLDFSSLLFPTTYKEGGDIRIDAMDVRIGLAYRPSRWGIRYDYAQILPLRVASFLNVEDLGGEGSGGTQHRLTFVLYPRVPGATGSPR